MRFKDRVYRLCRKIPKGRVTTYKILAEKLNTKAYRAVGQAMRKNPYAPQVPCHRVVASDGTIGGFRGEKSGKAIKEKKRMLQKEGIRFKRNKIVEFNKKVYRF